MKVPNCLLQTGEKFDQLLNRLDNAEIQAWKEDKGLKLAARGIHDFSKSTTTT